MNAARRMFAFVLMLTSTLLLITRVQADSWIGDSLELQVADADIVVRGTLESFDKIPGAPDQSGKFRIIETLKGSHPPSLMPELQPLPLLELLQLPESLSL